MPVGALHGAEDLSASMSGPLIGLAGIDRNSRSDAPRGEPRQGEVAGGSRLVGLGCSHVGEITRRVLLPRFGKYPCPAGGRATFWIVSYQCALRLEAENGRQGTAV